VEALRAHRRVQLEERLLVGEAWDNSWNLVLCTQVGAHLNRGNLLRRSLYRTLGRAGVPHIRSHDLRRIHPKVVQDMLAHASVTLTLDTYSRVLPSVQAEAAAKMESIFKDIAKRKGPVGRPTLTQLGPGPTRGPIRF